MQILKTWESGKLSNSGKAYELEWWLSKSKRRYMVEKLGKKPLFGNNFLFTISIAKIVD